MVVMTALFLTAFAANARTETVSSPDGRLTVTITDDGGQAKYAITYDGKAMLLPSLLGFEADFGDFTSALTISSADFSSADKTYAMRQTKQSTGHYQARIARVAFSNSQGQKMTVEMSVGNNDVAYRYLLPRQEKDNPKCAVIRREVSSFLLPEATTTFLSPQIDPMKGWERTKPSYEEEYVTDAKLTAKSQYGQGYTFPCLFRVGDDGWLLISETGVSSQYCGSHLSDYAAGTGYTIAYPQPGENNGIGTVTAGIPLPGQTPWRTITIGSTLKPIVETTVSYDLVEPLYKPSQQYAGGRYTWSWLIWQDNSINYDDQVKFIDLAAAMGFEYCLVDNWWDQNIGRERMAELSRYAQSKGVSLLLWYNSNGFENDAPQTPRDCMSTSVARDREMAWLKSIGVKGIKVDFFGGDKQQTMQLYEDILFDANRYGLQCVFHGCTIPRGWEVMYPNYVASEAVLASENVYFSEHHAEKEAFELCMHPFCRNAVGTMDWGGTIMNKYMSRDNRSRHRRYTTDIFEMAAAITTQTAVQCIAMQPNNLEELPQFEIDFLQAVPTTWDETRFIDGYPGRYVVLARRHGVQWYVAGLNAESQARTLTVCMPELAGQSVSYYTDDAKRGSQLRQLTFNKRGEAKVTIQPNGGIILTNKN
jgi:hypothetical protein